MKKSTLTTNLIGRNGRIKDDNITRGNQYIDQLFIGRYIEIVAAFTDEDGAPKFLVEVHQPCGRTECNAPFIVNGEEVGRTVWEEWVRRFGEANVTQMYEVYSNFFALQPK
jgi:hypothetical protein